MDSTVFVKTVSPRKEGFREREAMSTLADRGGHAEVAAEPRVRHGHRRSIKGGSQLLEVPVAAMAAEGAHPLRGAVEGEGGGAAHLGRRGGAQHETAPRRQRGRGRRRQRRGFARRGSRNRALRPLLERLHEGTGTEESARCRARKVRARAHRASQDKSSQVTLLTTGLNLRSELRSKPIMIMRLKLTVLQTAPPRCL